MSINDMPSTSAEYFARMVSINQTIANEELKLSGIDEMENGDDRLRLGNRIASLWESYYKIEQLYKKAYRLENGGKSRGNYMRTYYNGS